MLTASPYELADSLAEGELRRDAAQSLHRRRHPSEAQPASKRAQHRSCPDNGRSREHATSSPPMTSHKSTHNHRQSRDQIDTQLSTDEPELLQMESCSRMTTPFCTVPFFPMKLHAIVHL
ncbi:hypothetical protein IE81DRAFT_23552 [Ceraceosorus guamensis]|uniref:Uncharacterized protein n=1 Tax=Ceraceosorus guamensis TaxID=1522189 RepID=A0A316VPL3_9BASI|nr:hypothetical protein IE81DRAFT_23552 [Ceraceosorus guamensis]PWN39516.1 hypothetical protein IE81DRAFT_23552 [Ceraceosorus guamensis]